MLYNNGQKKRGAALSFRPTALIYLLFLIFALVFTQLLRSTASVIIFWFAFATPLISLVILLICKASIQVYVSADKNRTEKNSPVGYEVRIVNPSPFPCPYASVTTVMPRDDGVRTVDEKLIVSLLPFGGHAVKKSVSFRYRGLYRIGVGEIILYDYLRIFKARIYTDSFQTVTVEPRKLELYTDADSAVSDVPSPVLRVNSVNDRSEVSNIREYRMGDSMKSVHWKLSTKTEDLQVRDYNTNSDRHTYVFVDLSAPVTPPEVKKQKARERLAAILKKRSRSPMMIATPESDESGKSSKKRNRGALFRSLKKKAVLKREEAVRRMRRASGSSENEIRTAEMIDKLISETSGLGAKARKAAREKAREEKELKANQRRELAREIYLKERADEDLLIEQLRSEIGDISGDGAAQKDTEDEIKKWGGQIKSEYADEIPELCADGVVELAVAAMKREQGKGNICTVVWFDDRTDSGVAVADISSSASLESVCSRFASAAVCTEDKRISSLSSIIKESINVTVKILTANIDPKSLNEYAAVPAMFGGAGTGCSAELYLYDPWDKYADPAARREYAAASRRRLMQSGIRMTEVREVTRPDGTGAFMSVD